MAEFRVELERERSRADRLGQHFSLLALSADDCDKGDDTLAETAKILRRRLRLVDLAGWMENRTIGVVLPDTSSSGAWIVADAVCARLRRDLPRPVCTVFCYPDHHAPDSHGGGNGAAKRVVHSSHDKAEPMGRLFLKSTPLWKRVCDIAGATVGLVVLSPVFLAVAVAVKLTSRGPVLFAQPRHGQGGRPFTMYKFRSMEADAALRQQELAALNEQDGPAFKIKHDPRVTPLGRWLRKTSLDELPQLWNVLRGDMSLVGPRPLPLHESDACSSWQRRRLEVTPGLTCIWQVMGRSTVSFAEWMRMDIRYIHSRSISHDLKLLFKTISAVLYRKNGC